MCKSLSCRGGNGEEKAVCGWGTVLLKRGARCRRSDSPGQGSCRVEFEDARAHSKQDKRERHGQREGEGEGEKGEHSSLAKTRADSALGSVPTKGQRLRSYHAWITKSVS